MPNEAPTNPAGDEGDDRQPTPPWEHTPEKPADDGEDLLDALLGAGKKTDAPDGSEGPSDESQAPLSFEELFEKRVREAVRESEAAPASDQPPADDNPLGVYAELDQAEPPSRPKVEERKPRRQDRGKGRDRKPEPTREEAPPAEEAPEVPAPAEEPYVEPTASGEQEMAPESVSIKPAGGYDLPTVKDQPVSGRVSKEAPSHVADGDRLSTQQQARADTMAGEIAAAGPALAVRYGLMREIGLFQHHLEHRPVPGAKVTLRTERGVELGDVVSAVCDSPCGGGGGCLSSQRVAEFTVGNGPDYPLQRNGKVLRVANSQDLADTQQLQQVCNEAKRFCKEQIVELKLPMRLITVEHLLGGERMIFYFGAEGRVDFRDLVRRLSSKYQTRVEMRQVGARDEARLVGDFERCGRQCCCQSFMKDLKPISMRMAKVQKATLDPSKISGRCGRLMCCLRYEDEGYKELRGALPRKATWVRTETMVGKVVNTQILTQLAEIELADTTRVMIGVEEIIARDVEAPPRVAPSRSGSRGPSRTSAAVAAARAKPSASAPSMPVWPDDAPPAEDSSEGPAQADQADQTGQGGQGSPKKRRRRRPRRKPSGESTAPQNAASGPKPSGEGGSQPSSGQKRRRRRRRKK